ncbi:MAG TPA: YajG family lipoprotein [Rhodanobacteraceae bacterium]|nr:YajG family lipoprotein [Rhodanobacteraceae bacterium]
MKKMWFVFAAATLLSGCAFNAENVNLHPTISSPHTSEGQGVSVAVHVVDDRASKSLGHRGTAYGAAAEITTNADVAAIVSDKVAQALAARGFTVNGPDRENSAKLTVEVRLLDYSTSTGFWTGGVQVQAALKAVASKSGKNFEQMYRSNNEHRVVVVPPADTNEEWINETLGDVITKLVSDDKLIEFLAG